MAERLGVKLVQGAVVEAVPPSQSKFADLGLLFPTPES